MSSVEGIKMFFSNMTPLVNIMAFQPPKKCLYSIDDSKKISIPQTIKESESQTETYEINFNHNLYNSEFPKKYHWLQSKSYVITKPAKKSSVVVFHIHNTSSKDDEENFTLIYSHGNAATLGTIYSFLYDIATQFKCNVIGYDYNGYGKSKGKPSEKVINANIEDVYNFLRYSLKIPPEKIIVYGHSIGTVPSIDLSSKHNVGGLILECPIASGKLLVNPNYELQEDNIEKDSFCSWGKVANINCPTFLIHGMQDTVIPYDHSIALAEKIIHLVKWFPKKSGHTNAFEKYRSKFVLKVIKFLRYIQGNQYKNNSKLNKKEKDL